MEFLQALPPDVMYLTVLFVVMLESFGIPLPGEVMLMSAAFVAAHSHVNPFAVAVAAIIGAVIGDSIGYVVGHHYGRKLLVVLHQKLPHEFSDENIQLAEVIFARHGVWAVFFGRFVALLRIFAGPLSGILKLPYRMFALANITGAVLWAGSVTMVVYWFGLAVEPYLKEFSWVMLGIVIIIPTVLWVLFKPYMHRWLLRLAGERAR